MLVIESEGAYGKKGKRSPSPYGKPSGKRLPPSTGSAPPPPG